MPPPVMINSLYSISDQYHFAVSSVGAPLGESRVLGVLSRLERDGQALYANFLDVEIPHSGTMKGAA
jgi:hypothetical protein